jgi:hypothetical protein
MAAIGFTMTARKSHLAMPSGFSRRPEETYMPAATLRRAFCHLQTPRAVELEVGKSKSR